MTSTVPQLSHADVGNIMRLVEALNRSRLQFIRIETNGAEIQIAKEGTATSQKQTRGTTAAFALTAVTAPSVGVFRPDAAVRQGAVVAQGARLGHVHTLDETAAIEALVTGKIVEITASDGAFVEYGQVIIQILPTQAR